MIDLIALTEAQVTTFRNIAALVGELANADPAMVVGYVDVNPDFNSVTDAIYGMPDGSVLVAWQETLLNVGGGSNEMGAWVHRYQYFLRGDRDKSTLTLIDLLVNGVPVPGDGQRWRLCPVMEGTLPVLIESITRLVDDEKTDYFAITANFLETGDA